MWAFNGNASHEKETPLGFIMHLVCVIMWYWQWSYHSVIVLLKVFLAEIYYKRVINYKQSHSSNFILIHIFGTWISQCISKIKHILSREVWADLGWERRVERLEMTTTRKHLWDIRDQVQINHWQKCNVLQGSKGKEKNHILKNHVNVIFWNGFEFLGFHGPVEFPPKL